MRAVKPAPLDRLNHAHTDTGYFSLYGACHISLSPAYDRRHRASWRGLLFSDPAFVSLACRLTCPWLWPRVSLRSCAL